MQGLAVAKTTSGFNGAAVLGPRRDRPSRSCKNRLSMLQWGRGLGTAESHPLAPIRAMYPSSFNWAAVLGPRRAPACGSAFALVVVLQWGRGLGTAESALL